MLHTSQNLVDKNSALKILFDENVALKLSLEQERIRNEHFVEENLRLVEVLRQFKRDVYGKRSERWVPVEQTPLFNEAEVLSTSADKAGDEEKNKIEVKGQVKARGKRKPLPENLPREIIIIDIPDDEKFDSDGSQLVRLVGAEISEQLEYSPSSMKVIETRRLKYEMLDASGESAIRTAVMPPQLLPKSMARSSLVAGIVVHKFADGLPFYRLEELFERAGVTLPRQTMARWVVTVAKLCQPIWNVLEDRLMAASYVSVDETRTQVLKESGKKAESKSWMWVRANPGCDKKIILFDYDPSRSGAVAEKLFTGFEGYLQADGYAGYGFAAKTNEKIVRIGCNMHGRRYFEKARVSGLKQSRGLSEQGLEFYRRLYEVEERARNLSCDERFLFRLKMATPIWNEMKAWVDSHIEKVPPKGKIGQAFHYFINQYDFLRSYLQNGRLEIDNGFVERMIRKFAIGRNNWLFSDTVDGASASSLFYSLVITAKANGVEPYAALKRIFDELPLATNIDDFERLANYLLTPVTIQN